MTALATTQNGQASQLARPAMTQDRIPPRVDTPVDITFGGTPDPSAPVTLSIDGAGGGNGSATIDGSPQFSFAVSGTQTVNLRGVGQTAPGSAGHLKLVARQHGTLLAESNGFSVSSIPQNLSFTFDHLLTGAQRGFFINYDWESDSGTAADHRKPDLDQAETSERIELAVHTGIFTTLGSSTTGCYQPSNVSPSGDTHSVGPPAALKGDGVLEFKQTFMFKDKRTGAVDKPMTNTGFKIRYVTAEKPGSGFFFPDFQVTSSKSGVATTATDHNPSCPSGPISSASGSGSVPPTTQDV